MKYMKYLMMLAAMSFVSVSCDSDIEKLQVIPEEEFETPVLSSLSDLVINKGTSNEQVTFTSTPVSFGQPVAVRYEVTMTYNGESARLVTAYSPVLTVTKGDINSLAVNTLGVEANSSATVGAYVTAFLGDTDMATAPSNTISFGITTYKAAYNAIYFVGDLTGNSWSTDNAPSLYETEGGSNIYTAVIDFTGGSGNFKLLKTREGGWDDSNQYNDSTFDSASSVNVTYGDDSGNLKMVKPAGKDDFGIYELMVDLNSDQFSIKATSISQMDIMGGWDGWTDPILLKYDAMNNVWKSSTAVPGGSEYKVRLNGSWDICYGEGHNATENTPVNLPAGNDAAYELLDGGNATVPAGGDYIIWVYADRKPYVVAYEAQ